MASKQQRSLNATAIRAVQPPYLEAALALTAADHVNQWRTAQPPALMLDQLTLCIPVLSSAQREVATGSKRG